MRGKRARPTSLHQTRTSTSCVMSDPSSFLPITALLWSLDRRHCISSLGLSASDICGDLPPEVDSTVCAGDTIMHNKRQQSDVLQSFSVTSTRGRRETYLFRAIKLDMEMPPDTLEDFLTNAARESPAPLCVCQGLPGWRTVYVSQNLYVFTTGFSYRRFQIFNICTNIMSRHRWASRGSP